MPYGALSMKKRNKPVNKIGDNRGTSMATVVVSFALLLLFVTGYFHVQKVVGNIMMSAKDIMTNNSALIKAYYLEETKNTVVEDEVRLTFSGEDGGFFIETTLNQAQTEGLEGSIYYFAEDTKEAEE